MKNLSFLIAVVLLLSSCASKEHAGKFTIKNGVNVSHWLSQSEKRGEERKNYITQADFDTIAACGFDHVRLPIDEMQMWDSLGNKEKEAFELMHNAIKWALNAKLRVIVDLHIIRSHYFNAKTNTLWTDPAEQQKLVGFWKQLSDELIQYPNDMVAYEILNEAVADNPDDWNNLVNMVVTDIRKREPNRTIVIGSNRWQGAETFPDLKVPANDANIILSYHFYHPFALTHHTASWTDIAEYTGPVNYPGMIVDTLQYASLSPKAVSAFKSWANGYFTKDSLFKRILPAIETAKKLKLPLYCGEFGVYPSIPEDVKLRWYTDMCSIFKENGIANAHWCYKGDFPIVGEHSVPKRELVTILTGK
jgi:endoglucanase